MPSTGLSDRSVILVSGPDAESFLQNLITTDLSRLVHGEALAGALLSPQGKILFDFLISRTGDDGLRIDCRGGIAADLLRRLTLYRLRARVDFSQADESVVSVGWGDESATSDADSSAVVDRRFMAGPVVTRHYGRAREADAASLSAWQRLRIEAAVAECGVDYPPAECFPHDILLDQNGGVGLRKGCYVGQEVVSRMHHRGTARRRLVLARADRPLPAMGTELTADGRSVGVMGSSAGEIGLSIARLDKVKDAMDAGVAIIAGTVPVSIGLPASVSFGWPQGSAEPESA